MLEVVAALLREGERALLCQRPEGKMCAGCWEFAGGKIEPGESGAAALRRELREELGFDARVGEALADVVQDYPGARVHLTLYAAEIASGAPTRREHSDIRWVRMDEIRNYPLCPADAKLLARLCEMGWTELQGARGHD